MSLKYPKSAQALPLNTIVIALLVIVVLVVVIVAFTSNVSNSNQSFEEFSNSCDLICQSVGKDHTVLTASQVCSIPTAKNPKGNDCCCGEAKSEGGSGDGEDVVPNGFGLDSVLV